MGKKKRRRRCSNKDNGRKKVRQRSGDEDTAMNVSQSRYGVQEMEPKCSDEENANNAMAFEKLTWTNGKKSTKREHGNEETMDKKGGEENDQHDTAVEAW